jgi:glycosyltransferase involved in cell wall biosynthesis
MPQDPNNRLKILFLPRWYPNRYDPMPGLFIQRQAEAISDHCTAVVLYIHEDIDCPNRYEIDSADEGDLQVIRVYYKVPAGGITPLNKLLKLYRFFKACRLGFKMLQDFNPDLIHVHVLTRQGIIALIYKWNTMVPYVITEHWSRYFPENNTYKGGIRKFITGRVVRNASALIAVSEKLKEAMLNVGLKNQHYQVIPNPVDMNRFRIIEKEIRPGMTKKRMIHISCFEDKSKNISGFLRVIRNLQQKRDDFECCLIGEGPEWQQMKKYATDLGLYPELVSFPGLMVEDDLVLAINKAGFLVLSSQYETFGSVIIESLACGIPIVSTDVGIASAVVNESNGLVVPPGDGKALEEAISFMLDHFHEYDRKQIRESVAGNYNDHIISRQLIEVYKEVTGGRQTKK